MCATDSAPRFKLYVRAPGLERADLQAVIAPLLGTTAEVSTSGAPFVEATAAGVNKASGLTRVAHARQIDSDRTIAFGDHHNDIPMLGWAGQSVAMGNAVPELIQIARFTTGRNTEDGVADFLEQLMETGRL